MKEDAQRFIRELEIELEGQKDKESIVADYEMHIAEMQEAEGFDQVSYELLVMRLGTPQEIAKIWQQETGITPRKTQWLFVLLNMAIFIVGSLAMLSYHLFSWVWLSRLWQAIMTVPMLVLFVYLIFWALLGYEFGKEFGHRGLRLLRRTFLIAIIPNILFIYLVLFKLLPIHWLSPLLTNSFIGTTVVFTSILYPVSLLGYHWGKKVSI